MASSLPNRHDNEPVFVLHTRPYRETSLLVDFFSRAHGLITVVARGARRPRSEMRGVLMPFQPLAASWFGKTELKTLHRVEWQGGLRPLSGRAIMRGFYLNELLLRLLPREDAHETLYDGYADTLRALSAVQANAAVLRLFELSLLEQLGYGLLLDREAGSLAPVVADAWYDYFVEQGPVRVEGPQQDGMHFAGQTLLEMARGDFGRPQTLQESRMLMRLVLSHYLNGAPLYTPQLLKDLNNL